MYTNAREKGAAAAAISWNGSPLVLQVGDNANLSPTANGTMVFAYLNQTPQNNQGTLSVTSGGGFPTSLQVPARANQPFIWKNNWQGNNLSVTNVSAVSPTPILVMAYGPGVPGQPPPLTLKTDGTAVALAVGQAAQGTALPRYMNLVLRAGTGDLTVLAAVGGPPDETGNNGYVFALNAAQNSGPGTGVTPPDGYFATTRNNYYTFQFNWGSSSVYAVNLSPATATGATVALSPL